MPVFFSPVFQLTCLTDERSSEGVEEGQKILHRALPFFFHSRAVPLFGFAHLLFKDPQVCTNVCHSEDEVLLFGKHLGLSMNDVHLYLAPFVLNAWVGWRGLVSSRHIRVRRWSCTPIKALSVDSHEPVYELSMSADSYTLCWRHQVAGVLISSSEEPQVSSYTQIAPMCLSFKRVVLRLACVLEAVGFVR